MTKADLSRIVKRLAAELPEFVARHTLLLLPPVDHTLRAVCLERSSAARAFYVWTFIQVLSVPSRFVYFNMGWRLEERKWSVDHPQGVADLAAGIRGKALPFLEPIQTARDAALAAKLLNHSPGGHTQRAMAYAFARHGDVPQAIRAIDRYLTAQAESEYVDDSVLSEVAEAKVLKEQLSTDPLAAQRQLLQWENSTREALGLQEFRSPHSANR